MINHIMKKIFTLSILGVLLPLTFAFANYDNNEWSYVFHLQYKEGLLGVNDSEKEPYTSIPQLFAATEDPAMTDFSGTIVSGKGKELATFGFNKPTSMVISLGKSILDVRAPYFANADHVTFFDKKGKRLFDVSLRGSSFCNDNNICNVDVGENSLNCPNDCASGEIIPPQTIIPPPIEMTVATTEEAQNPPTVIATPIITEEQSLATSSEVVQKKSPTTITLFVGGILLVLLSLVLIYLKRKQS